MALVGVGCEVEAVCPRSHPVTKTHAPLRIHPYCPFTPLRSISAAIDAAQPYVVIPCDDLATIHLHRTYDRALRSGKRGAAMRILLEDSLGNPASFAITTARAGLMTFAQERGIQVPATAAVQTTDDVMQWVRHHGLPAVLKADGTYGGRGVRIVHTEAGAVNAFHALHSPPSPARALKRAVINRDFNYVLPCALRLRSAVSVQRFVSGRNANSTVTCWHGEVVASITASVLHTRGEHGPASVLQLIDNAEIASAVEQIVRDLKLSGLVGFDFVIEEQTGTAYLIEMNPRATQVSHMNLGPGRNLSASLRAILSGQSVQNVPGTMWNEIITLFPQEWLRDPTSPFLQSGYHDVPWEEPGLIRACLREDLRYKSWSMLSTKMRRGINNVGKLMQAEWRSRHATP
jgi:hypothetical protein